MGNNNITRETWSLLDTEKLHPGFSLDCVVFSFQKKALKVLLTQFKIEGYWALPGGFMYDDESAESAATRVLHTRTGLEHIPLTQFHLFSDPNRTVIEQNKEFVSENKIEMKAEEWIVRRFISLGFYAFIKGKDSNLPIVEGEIIEWYDIDNLPRLYSDHQNIIETALRLIPSLMPIVAIAHALLPDKFTISELRRIYERFLQKEFDRRNFQRKMLADGYIIQLDEKEASNAYNPPYLYSFDSKKIEQLSDFNPI